MNKALTLGSLAIFTVYFWFGALKVLSLSPASPLVLSLLDKTMPFMNPDLFLVLFGLFECLIGLLVLIPKTRKWGLRLVALHMVTVFLPLVLLPHMVWDGLFVPTLEGQYIIKNVLIIALAVVLWKALSSSKGSQA